MNLLLDTQAFVWWYEGSRKLGSRARRAIVANASSVHISVVSVWELAVKAQLGRLRFDEPLAMWVRSTIASSHFALLAVTLDHALAVETLGAGHGDPFDRILVAQARVESLAIVTADRAFDDYDVPQLDARI